MDVYQQFIAKSKYARFLDDKQRREHWPETVARYMCYMKNKCGDKISENTYKELETAILNLEVLPSMRLLMTAGPACDKSNVGSYNCAYIAIDDPKAFDELMYVLMCGTGVGFSVEERHIKKLPEIPDTLFNSDTKIVVSDSKEGWAKAFRQLIALLYSGEIPKWDVSKVRPKGARLKTFGGRASGPAPLVSLFEFTVNIFKNAVGRKLNSLECHDIVCKVADIVIVGSVRRCLPEDSHVLLEQGYKKIKDVKVGDYVKSEFGQFKKVVATSNVGEKPVVEIKTNIGKLYSTPEHRWAVLSDPNTGEVIYKEAQHLDPISDRLVFVANATPGCETSVPPVTYSISEKAHTLKTFKTEDLTTLEWAYLVGYLLGDGYVGKTEVTFAVAEDMPETKDKIVGLLTKLGLNINVFKPNDERCYKIRVASTFLVDYMSKFKQPKKSLTIPEFVKLGTVDTRLNFIAGILDSDGSCKSTKKGRKVLRVVSSVYASFLNEIETILATLGYPSKLTFTSRASQGWQDIGAILVCGPNFKDHLAQQLLPLSEKIRKDYNFCKAKRDWFSLPSSLHKTIKHTVQVGPTASWDKLSKFTSNDTHYPVTIHSVCQHSNQVCYDLQVEDTECFTVNGVLTHNSALISLSDLNDERMRKAKTGEWWTANGHRALANNSANYREKPEIGQFMQEWLSLYESKSGERGIFNSTAIKTQVEKFEKRQYSEHMGTNPSLRKGTLVLTSEGVYPIEALESLDSFKVPTGFGSEADAFCRLSSPKARLFEIKFKSGRSVFATAEHKWPVLFGTNKKQTSELVAGDKIPTGLRKLKESGNPEDRELGFLAGYWLGNGWKTKRSDTGHMQYGMCVPTHRADFIPRLNNTLKSLGVTASFSERSNGTYEFNTINNNLDSFFQSVGIDSKYQESFEAVWKNSNLFLKGLLEGLTASDGSVSRNRLSFSSKNKALRNFVSDLAFFEGFKPSLSQATRDISFTNKNGKVYNYPNYTIYKCRWSLKATKPSLSDTVVAVLDTGLEEPVWDLTVNHDTHTFVIAGMVTGNCSEIILNPNQFCNLSTIIVRPTDTKETIKNKIRLAAILGTYQSSLTYFPYLRKSWNSITGEECLLGVSMTGILDNEFLSDYNNPELHSFLSELRQLAVDTNKEFANKLGVNPSKAVTCIKPEGTTSQLCNTSSGLHGQHSRYYLRSIRSDNKDPITKALKEAGVMNEPCVMKPEDTTIFYFPKKASEFSVLRDDFSAVEQLELWLTYQRHYCEHKPSITVTVKEHEWLDVAAWVYNNWDEMTGVSFLPHSDHVYKQAPYQEITEEEYLEYLEKTPKEINWDSLVENTDNVEGVQTLACTSGHCEI